ncbi:hypothetical protein K438DRAFT_1814127, partial [Mycena galopus ATCC 62051]
MGFEPSPERVRVEPAGCGYEDNGNAPRDFSHVLRGARVRPDHRKRRRNRTTQSCLNCHTSKRKCDRKRPCQRCIQLGLVSCVVLRAFLFTSVEVTYT